MIGNIKDLERHFIESSLAKNSYMKVLVSPNEGWEDYVMRVVEVEKDGYTPKHQHDWPHINYIIEGNGQLFIEGKTTEVKSGSYAYVPANSLHQFKNAGESTFKFICIVPKQGHKL